MKTVMKAITEEVKKAIPDEVMEAVMERPEATPPSRARERVFVSGCFDMLHSGHLAFLQEAAAYGELYVGVGSDATLEALKGRKPFCCARERLFMVKAVRWVRDACVNAGGGHLDFAESVARFRPTVLVVNEDGHSPAKEAFCRARGLRYVVLPRRPVPGLEARSTTALAGGRPCLLPYRLDLAGTWIDQPYVSRHHPGWALTLSLEPTQDFVPRCGMSTSTRNALRRIWPWHLPALPPEDLARLAFCLENEPGARGGHISGAQDALGICLPGLSRHYYNGGYWPEKIECCREEAVLAWLEAHLSVVLLFPRPADLAVDRCTCITREAVAELATAAGACWEAILARDLGALARAFARSFAAQVRMFPLMLGPAVAAALAPWRSKALAWKLAGAGGGGYLVLLCETPPEGTLRLRIRREDL